MNIILGENIKPLLSNLVGQDPTVSWLGRYQTEKSAVISCKLPLAGADKVAMLWGIATVTKVVRSYYFFSVL